MNEHFVNVKVDREERRISTRSTWTRWWLCPARRLADDRLPDAGRRAVLRRTTRQARHGMPSFRQVLDSIARAWRDRRDDVSRAAAQLVEAVRQSAELRPSNDPLTDSVLAAAEQDLAATFEPTYGGWGRAPKFPNAPALEFLLRRGDAARAMAREDTRRDGRRRDVRPARRRLPPLLGRRPLARAALREDALRQRAAGGRVPARLARAGTDRYREIAGETIGTCCASCCCPRAVRLGAGRRHGRRRRPDAPGPRRKASPPGCSSRSSTAARSSAASSTRRRARDSSRSGAASKPLRDDKAIASWNGLALAALAEAGRRLGGRTGSRRARLGDFLLGPLSGGRGGCAGATATAHERRRYLDDYANVAHGLLELHVATGDLRWLRRRTGSRGWRSSSSPTTSTAASSSRPPTASSSSPGRRSWTTIRSRPATRCSRLLRLARIYGDDELERRAVSVLRPFGLRSSGCRRRSAGARGARPAPEPAARARDRRAVDSDVRARSSRGCRGGRGGRPGRGCTAARRQGAGRRAACRLRLRAVCVPGAGHRSGPHLTRMCQSPNFLKPTLSKWLKRSSLALQRGLFLRSRGVFMRRSHSPGWHS